MEYDAEKIVACMFDPVTSEIMAMLEHGPRALSQLAEDSGVSSDAVLEQLSYLVQHGFVIKTVEGSAVMISADAEKLASAIEGSGSFDGAVDGLETMDSYLN